MAEMRSLDTTPKFTEARAMMAEGARVSPEGPLWLGAARAAIAAVREAEHE